ncbi:Histone H4 [Ceratocystis fimbriata CBS 114723]|uniref:Histone H4 n=1 Tax=Ceratocystis fimbriata CBS 114723 TaxID=1035309 RepID=A0A2C5X303_9PEZI|nr:Histone H4 [Ceratocystis fimbriata CBS 114723]
MAAKRFYGAYAEGGGKKGSNVTGGNAVHRIIQKGIARRHRRLARRGGVKRISGNIYDTVRSAIKTRLEKILREAIIRSEYCKRKTVTVQDVLHALRHQGIPVYGFDPETYTHQAHPSRARLGLVPHHSYGDFDN